MQTRWPPPLPSRSPTSRPCSPSPRGTPNTWQMLHTPSQSLSWHRLSNQGSGTGRWPLQSQIRFVFREKSRTQKSKGKHGNAMWQLKSAHPGVRFPDLAPTSLEAWGSLNLPEPLFSQL